MSNDKHDKDCKSGGCSRREFFTKGLGAVAGVSFLLSAACTEDQREAFFQSRFKELKKSDMDKIIARLEREYEKKYSKKFTIDTTPAQEGVLFGYGLDLSLCVGCRRCVYECVKENNLSRSPQTQYIEVHRMVKEEGINLLESTKYYNPPEVPEEGHFYMPVACQQCRQPQCVRVCPVKATWQEPDGIVVVDYNWCIGCRYCMMACPYDARKFNWAEPVIPPEEMNTTTHYFGNRPRYKGVVEKCHWCIHRTRHGRYPACVEVCPVGARKFGNLLDPDSEIRQIINQKRVFILKEELNTKPKFYYFFGL